MNQEQLRAKTLALFHSLVSSWADDLRGDITNIQDQLNRLLDAVQERMARYEDKVDEGRVAAFADDVAHTVGRPTGGGLAEVRQALNRLDQGKSLQEVLTSLVQEVSRLAPRAALFVLKGGNCIGWLGHGFDQIPGFSNEAIKRISVPSTVDTVFRAVVTSRERFLGESTIHSQNVQLLARMGNVLPTNIFAMPLILRDKVAAVLYADSGDAREALSNTDAMEILIAYACKVLDLLSASKAPGRTTGEFSPEKAERLRDTGPGQRLVPLSHREEEAGTVTFGSGEMRAHSVPSMGPTPPTVAPPPRVPPALDPRLHDDAKRFARLLVSEIKLYNEAKVLEGRKNRDLYQLLKEDIDRSKKLYAERHPEAPEEYFNDEMVRILADGDASAIGYVH